MYILVLVYGLSSHYHHDVVTFDMSGVFLTLLVCDCGKQYKLLLHTV